MQNKQQKRRNFVGSGFISDFGRRDRKSLAGGGGGDGGGGGGLLLLSLLILRFRFNSPIFIVDVSLYLFMQNMYGYYLLNYHNSVYTLINGYR